ncbi:hypothetical protein [Umezawaea sp. NPDC059074]|uniref:hypothetical protein n=1 Tax=Umezawaea sp. NPDC059074 TaxID=3346716 RepID=UPI0036CCAC63
MNAQAHRDDAVRRLLASAPVLDRLLAGPHCVPPRAPRTLVGRKRRVVPVSALGGAA